MVSPERTSPRRASPTFLVANTRWKYSWFVIVPGNHDINRDEAEAYFIQCRPRRTQPQEPYLPKWKYYIEFFERFYQGEKEISFSPVDPWTLWEFEDLRLVVAGMNSTMKESHEEDSHYGWVGERQLRWFSDRLRKSKERGWFRLGVVHHNIERGAVTDDENLRDADDLKNILGPNLNQLLHGHTHCSKISWLKPSIPVLSTGSAALKTEARPPEVPNQYQVIRIRPDRIERWTRQYDVGGKRWIGDTRCSEKGDRWHVKDVVHFEDVYGALEPSWKEPEIHGRRESEALDRREDFATRVCEVARLKYRDSEVDIRRSDASRLDYLHVRVMDGTVARIQPIGVTEHGISGEQIEAFGQEVVAQYRSLDPTLPCAIVYGGDLAAQELVHKASGMGIGLVSFVEFQGIVDFRGYVQRQTEKIISDIVYPYGLYVPQRMLYEIGRDQHESGDACATILEWLKEPFGRFALVLGDFGTGKTFLMHELARRIPVEIPHLTPVLIELRNLEKAGTFGQLIAQHLAYSGETRIDLEAFPYMLKEGRIVLLFDGFDELVLRVTYQRATEHLDTLLQSAQGRARVVVSSRTQHFESDAQVRTALYQRAEVLPSLRVARLQLFDDAQILKFLENLLKGDREQAARRFALIHDIRDLLGLSQNPRMLSFIAALPEEQLRDAQESKGKITSAELYRMLIERWLTFEEKRLSPSGAVPTLNVQERWDAVATVALCLWPRLDRTLRLTELTEEAAHIVEKLTQAQKAQLDTHTLTHLVGSGTLLVRDESGAFAFVHQSVMEWLVADHAAKQMVSGSVPSMLMSREMSDLMTDFFCDLAGEKAALQWTVNTLTDYTISEPAAKSNAVRVRTRLGYEIPLSASLVATDLRGRSLSGQNFSGANLQNADLTDARLDGADEEDVGTRCHPERSEGSPANGGSLAVFAARDDTSVIPWSPLPVRPARHYAKCAMRAWRILRAPGTPTHLRTRRAGLILPR